MIYRSGPGSVNFSNTSYYILNPFNLIFYWKQISMTVQAIPVRTTGPVQTEWTDLTAAVHQALMERNVKQVTVINNITNLNS